LFKYVKKTDGLIGKVEMCLLILLLKLCSAPVLAQTDLDSAVSQMVEQVTGPIQIGAGLGMVYGVFSGVVAIKEDNPQAKASAIKWLIGAGVLFAIAEVLPGFVGGGAGGNGNGGS